MHPSITNLDTYVGRYMYTKFEWYTFENKLKDLRKEKLLAEEDFILGIF